MKRFLILFFSIFLLLGIAGTVYFLNSDPAKAWTIKGDAFCHKRYSVCLENKLGWVAQFPPTFRSSSYLLILEKQMPDQRGIAKIVVTSLDSLRERHIRILSPATYLKMTINSLRRDCFKFEELQSPVNEFLDGRKVAKGQFLVARHSSDEPLMSLIYGFIKADKGCSIIYFASPDQYEKNLEDAMRIIRSFKFAK